MMRFVIIEKGEPTKKIPMLDLCDTLRMINDAVKSNLKYKARLIEKGQELTRQVQNAKLKIKN